MSLRVCEGWPHVNVAVLGALESVDLRHDSFEVLCGAVSIDRCSIRPFLNEDEVAGIFVVDKELVGDVQWLLPRERDEFAVERQYGVNRIESNKILRYEFQHGLAIISNNRDRTVLGTDGRFPAAAQWAGLPFAA